MFCGVDSQLIPPYF